MYAIKLNDGTGERYLADLGDDWVVHETDPAKAIDFDTREEAEDMAGAISDVHKVFTWVVQID